MEHRDELIRRLHLPQQEGREWIAGLVQAVPGLIEPSGAEAVEVEVARRGPACPAAGREVVMAELESSLDRMPSPRPCDVARELPAIVLLVPEPRPSRETDGRVGDAAAVEIHRGRSGILRDDTAGRTRGPLPETLRPVRTRRQVIAPHEPAIPRDRGVDQQVVVDDPVELLVRVVRGDALEEPATVVIGVLGRLLLGIELVVAPIHALAVAYRGTAVPVEAGARLEGRREVLVHAEHDVARVELPRLIAHADAGDVVGEPGAVGFHHQRHDPRGHRASERVAGGDDVARERIAHGNVVHRPRRLRIEDLPLQDRPSQRVRANLVARQQRAEVAGLERIGGRRIAEAGDGARADARVVDVHEKVRLVAAVVAGQADRTAEREAEVVVADRRLLDSAPLGEYRVLVERVVGHVLVHAAAERVGARLARVLDETAAGVPVLSGVGRRDDLHFLDGLERRGALVALLVAARIAEGRAVEEVLGGHRLAAVDTGVELAAAEHRVAVRPHRQVARLHEQHRFGQAHVGAGDER